MSTMLTDAWPVLLSVAAPFIFALAWAGKKLFERLEKSEDEKRELYAKIISDLLIAIQTSSTAVQSNTTTLERLLDFVEDLKDDLKSERELRVRFEERLRADKEIRDFYPSSQQRRGSGEGRN